MAIRVRHDPPLAKIADAAYYGGLGSFNQQQKQLQLQYDQMAADQLARQQSIAANLYSQERARQASMYDNAADRQWRGQMAGFEARQRAGELGMRREWDVADRDFAAEEAMRRAEADRMAVAARMSEDDRRAFIMERYKAGEWKLDGAGDRKARELRSAMSATKLDPSLTPLERDTKLAELDSRYWDILGSPPPKMPGDDPPAIGEIVNSKTAWIVGPDGINRQYQVTVRNGTEQIDVVAEQEPPDPAKADPREAERQKFIDSLIGKAKPKAEGEAPSLYTASDIDELWRERIKAQQFTAQSDAEREMRIQAEQQRQAQEQARAEQQAQQQAQRQQVEAAMAQFGVQWGDKPKQQQVDPIVMQALPRPATVEEAMQLPPGTVFMAPDGRIKQVPRTQ